MEHGENFLGEDKGGRRGNFGCELRLNPSWHRFLRGRVVQLERVPSVEFM